MSPDDPALFSPFEGTSDARLPRRQLTRGPLALLILLRIYVLLAVPAVVYEFIRAVWMR